MTKVTAKRADPNEKFYRFWDGKYQYVTGRQIEEATPEEDRKYLNRFWNLDKPIILSDSDDLAEKMAEWNKEHIDRLSYAIAVERDGQRMIYCRPTNPCLGNLTKYLDSHGEMGKLNETHPGDLHYDFPEGRPIGISIPVVTPSDFSYGLVADSPFSEALSGSIFFIPENTDIPRSTILVQTNMDIDPNVFWQGVKHLRQEQSGILKKVYPTLVSKLGSHKAISLVIWAGLINHYSHGASIRRLLTKNPHRIAMGKYSEGYGYTRANCEWIFSSYEIKYGDTRYYNNPSSQRDIKVEDPELMLREYQKRHDWTKVVQDPKELLGIFNELKEKVNANG